MQRLLIFCLLLSASGCASGSRFTTLELPATGNGVIYVYRVYHRFDGSRPGLVIDDLPQQSFPQKLHFRYETGPGKHLIKVVPTAFWAPGATEISVELAAGETKFVSFDYFVYYKFPKRFVDVVLNEVRDEATAVRHLRGTKGIHLSAQPALPE